MKGSNTLPDGCWEAEVKDWTVAALEAIGQIRKMPAEQNPWFPGDYDHENSN